MIFRMSCRAKDELCCLHWELSRGRRHLTISTVVDGNHSLRDGVEGRQGQCGCSVGAGGKGRCRLKAAWIGRSDAEFE